MTTGQLTEEGRLAVGAGMLAAGVTLVGLLAGGLLIGALAVAAPGALPTWSWLLTALAPGVGAWLGARRARPAVGPGPAAAAVGLSGAVAVVVVMGLAALADPGTRMAYAVLSPTLGALLGAACGAAPRRRASARRDGRRLAGDGGQSTLEWLGVGAVVVALIAAIVLAAPGLGGSVAEQLGCLIRSVVGGAGCGEEVSAEPERACTTSITTANVSGDVRIAFIDAGLGEGILVRETSDGRVHVTFIEEGSLGASLRAGAEGRANLGDNEVGLGANATIGAALEGELGDTRVFDDPDDAEAYIHDRLADEAIEALPPGVEQAAGIGKDILNGILGNDVPQGEDGSTHGQIGVTVEGDASASAGPLSAGVEAAVSNGARVTLDQDGGRTIRLEVSAEAAASLGIPVLEVGAGGGGKVQIELALAPDGSPETARVRVTGEGSIDAEVADSVTDVADGIDKLTTNLSGGEGERTVITAEVDLTDPAVADAFGDVLGAAATGDLDAVADAGGTVRDALRDAGTLTIETYDLSENGVGIGAQGNVGIGLGLDLGADVGTATLTDARYYDPATGTFVPWEGCLGGS